MKYLILKEKSLTVISFATNKEDTVRHCETVSLSIGASV